MSAVIALAACGGITGAATTPSTGNVQASSSQPTIDSILDSAPEVSGARFAMHKIQVSAKRHLPGFLINFVANGPSQGGVPCASCVNGASTTNNLGLTGPSSYVLKNFYWEYQISFSDLTYVGECKLAWGITHGKTVLDKFSTPVSIKSAGGWYIYFFSRPRIKYSGPAVLTGKVTCGKSAQSLSAPLEFQ
ncbi:MAG: hypothetical protein JO263_10195 [Candidatus Eremiobacteraeota bacterium]|nr:hypothetical protein [Candidatus Eremiobacteraeota bacterium]